MAKKPNAFRTCSDNVSFVKCVVDILKMHAQDARFTKHQNTVFSAVQAAADEASKAMEELETAGALATFDERETKELLAELDSHALRTGPLRRIRTARSGTARQTRA
jgi:outer membrane murein-binding lipoprotein Lpp